MDFSEDVVEEVVVEEVADDSEERGILIGSPGVTAVDRNIASSSDCRPEIGVVEGGGSSITCSS